MSSNDAFLLRAVVTGVGRMNMLGALWRCVLQEFIAWPTMYHVRDARIEKRLVADNVTVEA